MAYPDATPESQEVMASKNINNPEVIRSISRIANAKGLTEDACVDTVIESLQATKAFVVKEGDDFRIEERPEYATRLKAAELGLKVHGHLKDNKTILPVPVTKEQYQSLCVEFWNAKPKP